jgi:phage terminase large subunit-like protein
VFVLCGQLAHDANKVQESLYLPNYLRDLRMPFEKASRVDLAVKELGRLSSKDEALAILDGLDKKRRDEQYTKYWSPINEDQELGIQAFVAGVKTLVILGGNRSGKTVTGAQLATAWCLGKEYYRGEPAWKWIEHLPIPEPPNNVWVVGLDFATLRDVIWREKLRFGKNHPSLLPKNDGTVTKINDSDYQVFFTNGSILTGKSADSGREKFQGASVDLVWIDEECEVDIYDECYQRTVDCDGKILVTATPLADVNSAVRQPWIYDLYRDWLEKKSDLAFVFMSVLKNPVISQAEKDKLLEKWTGHPEEQARLYGRFIQRGGLVYNTWDAKKHLVAPFRIPLDWPRFVSIDPAATGVTAALWAAIDPQSNIFLYREYYESDKVVSEHAKNITLRNGIDQIDVWLIDPFWGRQRNNETHRTGQQLYRDNNIPVRLAPLSEDYGINESREYINATVTAASKHPKVYIFKDMANFREEIERYTWDTFQRGENKGLSKEKPRKRDDHLMNAFQYLCSIRPRGRRNASITESKEDAILRIRNNSSV